MLHKLLKKSDHEIHIFANTLIVFIGIILFFGVILLVLKHYALKSAITYFTAQARIESTQRASGVNAVTNAQLLAATVVNVPSDKPLLTQKSELQKYVTLLSKQTGRDIVVLDRSKIILADTIASNSGGMYGQDKSNEVGQTITDGISRGFVEKSKDYPVGISEVVVPLKDTTGKVEGALILSVYPVTNTY